MLEEVFAGNTGLASTLIKTLGGTAIFKKRLDGGVYESQEISFVQESLLQIENASKIPGGKSWDTTVMSNGLRRLETSFICYVPSSELTEPPRVGFDLLCVDGTDHTITEVGSIRAGNATVAYRLVCVRV